MLTNGTVLVNHCWLCTSLLLMWHNLLYISFCCMYFLYTSCRWCLQNIQPKFSVMYTVGLGTKSPENEILNFYSHEKEGSWKWFSQWSIIWTFSLKFTIVRIYMQIFFHSAVIFQISFPIYMVFTPFAMPFTISLFWAWYRSSFFPVLMASNICLIIWETFFGISYVILYAEENKTMNYPHDQIHQK